MPKKLIDPEIREKIIQMRLDGLIWKEIKEKLGLSANAETGIYKADWFIKGMRVAREKWREKQKKNKDKKHSGEPIIKRKKEETKEEIKVPIKQKKEETKTLTDEEIEKHIKGSDKAPANIKKKEPGGSGKTTATEEKKEEKKEKNSFGLWAILIIALIIGVVVIFFLLKGKKAEVKEGEEQKPKTIGFEGRTEEDL